MTYNPDDQPYNQIFDALHASERYIEMLEKENKSVWDAYFQTQRENKRYREALEEIDKYDVIKEYNQPDQKTLMEILMITRTALRGDSDE